MKKVIEYSLVALCLIPLFFINIRDSHDWGDDFAQYIHQAKNITEGISQNETGYIFNENCFTGPQAYPTGFPLLLSPIVRHYGFNYKVFDLFMTLFLALTCFTGFLLLRRYTSYITALATALIIAYNPIFLNFKTEVISDLPFAFFSMLCIYIILQRESMFFSLLLGCLMGFTIHIRSVGAIVPIVFIVHRLFIENNIRDFSFKKHLNTIVCSGLACLVYIGIKLAFPCNSNYPFFDSTNLWERINDHFSDNIHHLSELFMGYMTPNYYSIGIIASSCLIAFSILGFLHFFRDNKKSILSLYVPVYLILVLSYKLGNAGMRFLYPILFFIFLFAITGLKKSLETFTTKGKWLAVGAGTLVLFSYWDEIITIRKNEGTMIDGPQTPEAWATFQFINSSLPENTIIEFDKPRALTLYTRSRSFAFNPAISHAGITSDIQKFDVAYILISETQTTDNIKSFPVEDTLHCKSVYQNSQFNLFKIDR